jgi:cyclophilin family peptidyl-prolyl cis-trans isomerase
VHTTFQSSLTAYRLSLTAPISTLPSPVSGLHCPTSKSFLTCLLLTLLLPLAITAQEGIFADFTTSLGTFTCELSYSRSPRAVGNFIALATGTRPWVDDLTGQVRSQPFYEELTFHRVIAGFMIQTGSRNGQGTDGPGYVFPDTFDSTLRHDSPGVLSMANSGPNSNGAQFFIAVTATPWLDAVHTVFGRVIEGYSVVQAISQVDTDDQDRPRDPVQLHNIRIRRVGADAQAFDIHAQSLPEVSSHELRLVRQAALVTLNFGRPLHADLRLLESTHLDDWSSTALGIDLEPGSEETIARTVNGSARFFSLTRIQYPASTLAPRSLADRNLVLTLDGGGGPLALEFDGAGGGLYTFGSGAPGTITGSSWLQEPYRGRLSLSTSGLVPMALRLDFNSETAGILSGTAYASPPFSVTGTFTLAPR